MSFHKVGQGADDDALQYEVVVDSKRARIVEVKEVRLISGFCILVDANSAVRDLGAQWHVVHHRGHSSDLLKLASDYGWRYSRHTMKDDRVRLRLFQPITN